MAKWHYTGLICGNQSVGIKITMNGGLAIVETLPERGN
jgi:hypothetical protein